MITLPAHVIESDKALEGHAWDGLDSVSGYKNKETSMDWAEHQRIVCLARHLLQGDPPGNSAVRKIFGELKSAFNDPPGRTVVRVSKGIHQPTVDPHLQLRTITTYDASNVSRHKFHLNVSATAVPVTENLDDDRFHWTPVQFSFLHTDKQTYFWPKIVSVEKKGSAKRRLSISPAQLKAHIDAQTLLKQEAADALMAEAFETALAAFHVKYGGKKGKVNYSNPAKQVGDFPNEKFRNGNVNATVTISTQSKPAMVHYNADRKEIIVGPKPG